MNHIGAVMVWFGLLTLRVYIHLTGHARPLTDILLFIEEIFQDVLFNEMVAKNNFLIRI